MRRTGGSVVSNRVLAFAYDTNGLSLGKSRDRFTDRFQNAHQDSMRAFSAKDGVELITAVGVGGFSRSTIHCSEAFPRRQDRHEAGKITFGKKWVLDNTTSPSSGILAIRRRRILWSPADTNRTPGMRRDSGAAI